MFVAKAIKPCESIYAMIKCPEMVVLNIDFSCKLKSAHLLVGHIRTGLKKKQVTQL